MLLVDALRALRMGERVPLYDPLGPVEACATCADAYAEARRFVESAGGLRAWSESVWSAAPARAATQSPPGP